LGTKRIGDEGLKGGKIILRFQDSGREETLGYSLGLKQSISILFVYFKYTLIHLGQFH
jgi:hypothetical protein